MQNTLVLDDSDNALWHAVLEVNRSEPLDGIPLRWATYLVFNI